MFYNKQIIQQKNDVYFQRVGSHWDRHEGALWMLGMSWVMFQSVPTLFPSGSAVEYLLANAGDAGSIPWSGRSSGKGNGNLLQYSCLGNPMDRGAWWAIVHRATELDMTEVT